MKKWECVQVDHHMKIAEMIEKYQREGWQLHTYQASSISGQTAVKHYLLFVKD